MRPYARVRMLTREEYEELKRMERRRKLAASRVQRARIILLSNQGYLMKEIASELGCHEKTASRWIGRFNELGMAGLEEYPREGRPRVYSPEEVGTVIQTALSSPTELGLPFGSWTLDRLVAYLSDEKGIGMKRTRIAEILSKEGLRWRKQEGWFGERVDPEFAAKRGPSSGSTHPLLPIPCSSA